MANNKNKQAAAAAAAAKKNEATKENETKLENVSLSTGTTPTPYASVLEGTMVENKVEEGDGTELKIEGTGPLENSEPEQLVPLAPKVTPTMQAINASLNAWVVFHKGGDEPKTVKGANTVAEGLKRAYTLALADKNTPTKNLLEIFRFFHSNPKYFNANTLYAGAPSTDREWFMAITQWIYAITREDEKHWAKEMGMIGTNTTQRIIRLTSNPRVALGLEKFVEEYYPD